MPLSIGLFKKKYTVRQYGQQQNVDGYYSAPYSDTVMLLNVQPLTPDELKALPEGEKTVKRLKSYGKAKMQSADEFVGIPGDRLFYQGLWYECVSSNMWDHTPLAHYESKYVLLPPTEQEEPPLPPVLPEPPSEVIEP